MIEITNLSFAHSKSKPLYANVSLSFKSGHIYGLLGKNGAGKSTLLKLLTGMLFPKSGSILVNNYHPKNRNPNFLQSIYFIPEEVEVPPISIKKYLSLFSPFYPKFNEDEFYNFLLDFNVDSKEKLNNLSFGQQKKFTIAFALACNTEVLLLDEPTNGLDIPAKSWFRKIISMALNNNRLIIISTHQVRDLDQLIDSVTIINEGKVIINEDIKTIESKLQFHTTSQIKDAKEILYQEKGINGFDIVTINETNNESMVNLEHLFETCTQNSEKIIHLFSN